MTDFTSLRETMVASQIRPNRVTDTRLLAALMTVPRETFLPAGLQPLAYASDDISLASPPLEAPGRHMLSPLVFAWLAQTAAPSAGSRALCVGSGTGYPAAVLAMLCGQVTALEVHAGLAAFAQKELTKQGFASVSVVKGPLAEGYAAAAPYDVIILNGSAAVFPEALDSQLAEGGRLTAVMGSGAGGKLVLREKIGGAIRRRIVLDAWAPPLPGFEEKPAFVF